MTGAAGVRFERIEVRYGRHAAAFDLVPEATAPANGAGRGPFVILGPNGAGKSTLVEALLRTLFGFHRLRAADRETHDLRRPWRGGGYHGRLRVRTPDGAYTFERDFDSDRVRVLREGSESPVFEDEANPARGGEAMVRYRSLLERTVGLVELDAYLTTACVFQGTLMDTDLDLGLLRVAAGGHADIETARLRLEEEYRELTVEPIAPDAARRRKPGVLERAEEEVAELEARLEEARTIESRRLPLVRARDELRGRLDALEGEVGRLSDAFVTLSEAQTLDLEAEASRGRIRAVETVARDLDEALARFDLLTDQAEKSGEARYPADFETRARLLEEELWPALADLDRELARLRGAVSGPYGWLRHPAALAGLLGMAGAGAVLGATVGPAGWALAGLGVTGAAVRAVVVRSERMRVATREARISELEAERAAKQARSEGLREGVPDGGALGPDSLPAHRREFRRERGELELRAEAERHLRQTMDAARRVLETVDAPSEEDSTSGGSTSTEPAGGAAAPPAPGPAAGPIGARARDLLKRLHERATRERDDVLAPLAFRLGELGRSRIELPADVDPTPRSVRRARSERLAAVDEVRRELGDVEGDLALEARQGESALSITRELESARGRARALAARAEAYRRAHALIARAYEEFRRTDEERLVAAISEHLIALSGGELGPLEVDDGLESARVRAGARALSIDSPPLSYGQLHAALLAVRLGAADFLAGLGVRVPLVIDDPFVHLDERSAADLWGALERVAGDRQVVIATQDRLVLAHLGVAADLVLPDPDRAVPEDRAEAGRGEPEEGAALEDPTRPERSAAGPEEGSASREVRGGDDEAPATLDLWSQTDA